MNDSCTSAKSDFGIFFLLVSASSQKVEIKNETVAGPTLPMKGLFTWTDGVVPYSLDFYSANLFADTRRLGAFVRSGLDYMESMSCLRFVEWNPKDLAPIKNMTYLIYTYTSVLESCCLPSISSRRPGRRVILITPKCTLPEEVAHATLHAFGVTHMKKQPMNEQTVLDLLFITDCIHSDEKKKTFYSGLLL